MKLIFDSFVILCLKQGVILKKSEKCLFFKLQFPIFDRNSLASLKPCERRVKYFCSREQNLHICKFTHICKCVHVKAARLAVGRINYIFKTIAKCKPIKYGNMQNRHM